MKTLEDIDLEKVYTSLCSLTSNFEGGIERPALSLILHNILRYQIDKPISFSLIRDVIKIFCEMLLLREIENKFICSNGWEEAWKAIRCRK